MHNQIHMKDLYRYRQDMVQALCVMYPIDRHSKKIWGGSSLLCYASTWHLQSFTELCTQYTHLCCKNSISLSSQHLVCVVLLIQKHVLLLSLSQSLLSHSKSPTELAWPSVSMMQENHWNTQPQLQTSEETSGQRSVPNWCGCRENLEKKNQKGPSWRWKQPLI